MQLLILNKVNAIKFKRWNNNKFSANCTMLIYFQFSLFGVCHFACKAEFSYQPYERENCESG